MNYSVPQTMKALRFPRPWRVELIETPVPDPGPNEVLTRIDACGICGSDVGIFEGEHWIVAHEPGGHGHETGATVVAVGSAVSGIEPGDRVARMGYGYAQYSSHVNVIGHGRDEGTHPLPIVRNDLSSEEISFADAVGCALNCAQRAELERIEGRRPKALARGWGAEVWDPFAYPRRSYGRRRYVDAIREEFGPADAVFEMAGQPSTLAEAIELVRPGFRVLVFGARTIQVIPYADCRRKGIELVYPEAMVNSKAGVDYWNAALDLIAGRDGAMLELESLITARIPLEEAPSYFEKYDRESFIKIIVEPNR